MGKKTRTGVLKRQREAKKAEKAALKREKRLRGEDEFAPAAPTAPGDQVATAEDLEGYGFIPMEDEVEAEDAETQ